LSSSRSFLPLGRQTVTGRETTAADWRPGRLHPAPVHRPASSTPDTRRAADADREQAYLDGYAAGMAACREELEAERRRLAEDRAALERARIELEALRQHEKLALEQQRATLLRQLQLETVELAVALAERLLRAELRLAPDTVIRVAREALGELDGSSAVRLKVCPQDAATLREAAQGLAHETGVAELEIIPQPHLEPGEVEVETSSGGLDGRWACQLARLRRALHRAVAGEEGP